MRINTSMMFNDIIARKIAKLLDDARMYLVFSIEYINKYISIIHSP